MKRKFKGVWIPKEIWLSKELSIQEKVFLVEIDSLDNEEGCYAKNAYFSEFFDVSKSRCSQVMTSLKEKGYISIDLIYKGKEVDRRVVRILKGGSKYSNRPLSDIKHPPLENCEDNNTEINNTVNDKSEVNSHSVLPELLFPDLSPGLKSLFRNSVVNTYDLFSKQFTSKEFENVDLNYYYHSVKDWSEMNTRIKRDSKGWVATARNFMRRDNNNKMLKLLSQNSVNLSQAEIDYLKL